MIHCIVINLLRQSKRKELIKKEFARAGITSYEFFTAVDGIDGIDGNDQSCIYKFAPPTWHNYHSGKAITKGEIGCALSHYSVWDLISSDTYNHDLTLILEDDIIFVDDFVDKFHSALNSISFPYDIFYLGRDPCEFDKEIQLTQTIRTVKYSYGAHAYILTKSCAKILYNSSYLSEIIPVDDFLAILYGSKRPNSTNFYDQIPKLKAIAAYPNLIKLSNPSESDTFVSEPYEITQPYKFGENKEFVVLFGSDSERFKKYCKIYGLPLKIIAQEIKSYILKEKLHQTLILYIENPLSLIICSPQEIIDKYILIGSLIESDGLILGFGSEIIYSIATATSDSSNLIFQPAISGIKILSRKNRVQNIIHNTLPCVIYSNSSQSSLILNQIENYTGSNWNDYYGFGAIFPPIKSFPKVFFAYKSNKSFQLPLLSYDPNLLNLQIFTTNPSIGTPAKFCSLDLELFKLAINLFLSSDAEYFFFLEEDFVIKNPDCIQILLSYSKSFVSPMLRKENSTWSNFWGEIDSNGYYKRSFDYVDILERKKKGLWNVPYVVGCYLIQRKLLENNLFIDIIHKDIDMQFCLEFRRINQSMYLSNLDDFGLII